MKRERIMIIAGEASGDLLAAELVKALTIAISDCQSHPSHEMQPLTTPLTPEFFGAGGPKMAAAGAQLAFDMTKLSVIGLSDVLKNYLRFRAIFHDLLQLAIRREPDLIVLVDFSGFNRRFAHSVKEYVRRHRGTFTNWSPKIVQYVSPQVWASRPGRAEKMARDFDLLLCLFPFEKDWYGKRVPNFPVEFVGHPIADRFPISSSSRGDEPHSSAKPELLLLPGSRPAELQRHLPVMLGAAARIKQKTSSAVRMVLPNEALAAQAAKMSGSAGVQVHIQTGNLPEALAKATVAIASTGTVLLECAWFGVPTVAIYKTSWSTYQIGKRIVQVKYLSMPNILANDAIFPEFIQNDATAENIAREALDLLTNKARQTEIKAKLAKVVSSLGPPGASERAADAIANLMGWAWPVDLRASLRSG